MLAMAHITRRPLFWFCFLSASLLAGITAYHYFPKAFSILHVDINMNREEALRKAKCIANQYGWGPADFEQTTVFISDDVAKNFIELEGGGKATLNEIIKKKIYAIYRWTVRHFKEYSAHETYIIFTPQGVPYGFKEQFAENEPGRALSKDEAQALAEKKAIQDWNISFEQYTLVESSAETKPNGRIDHSFIYELKKEVIKEGKLRLTLGVTGDIFSHLEHSVRVPDAFKRRYDEMRSFNETLAYIAILFVTILYILGGCIIGLFLMIRSRNIIWKQPFLYSGILSILSVLSTLSAFPSIWISYDTALAKTTIYTQFMFELLRSWATVFIGFGIIFAVAEALTRKAFGKQPQLWKVWSRENASSIQILGRTISGYALVTIDLCFCVIFYYFMGYYFKWWSPSSTLINPNILSEYMPWISAISNSLNAGAMEECLFRAIPLASIFLLGKRFGKPRIWLYIGLIIQAIIFGAGHASYPAQPFYARLVELIVPSLLMGVMYIFYGLLPIIIMHVIYDIIWFALPIFLSSAQGIWIQQTCVLLASSIPIVVVAINRIRLGSWHKLPKEAYNDAWQVPEKKFQKTALQEPTYQKYRINPTYLIIMSIISLALWSITTSFKQDDLPLTITKSIAQDNADRMWESYDSVFTMPPWKKLSIAHSVIDAQHVFIWQKHKDLYKKLLGTYLAPAQWYIRYVQFEGNLIDRAEEFWAILNPSGTLFSRKHIVPEAWPGAKLSEEEARTKIHAIMQKDLHLDLQDFKEISAISEKLPERIDWYFIFQDTKTWPSSEQEGQVRIKIKLSGDMLSEYEPYVFVPEKWERDYRHQQTILQILTALCMSLTLALFLLGLLHVFKQWLHNQFRFKLFFILCAGFIIKSCIQLINLYDIFIFMFKTSVPYMHQLFTTFSSSLVQSIMQGATYALLLVGTLSMYFRIQRIYSFTNRLYLGTSLGLCLAAVLSLVRFVIPSNQPLVPEVLYAAASSPILGQMFVWLTTYISLVLLLYLVFYMLEIITNYHSTWLTALSALIFGLVVAGRQGIVQASYWLCSGITVGILFFTFYRYYVRYDRALIPLLVGTYFISSLVQQALIGAWLGVGMSAILTSAAISIMSIIWSSALLKKS